MRNRKGIGKTGPLSAVNSAAGKRKSHSRAEFSEAFRPVTDDFGPNLSGSGAQATTSMIGFPLEIMMGRPWASKISLRGSMPMR